ncbi:MAG: cysteine desulfurase NifS [Dehalococcoidia bacterium]|nr:cysteine desulfurase NifS [Dehalococcoidia bacterium]
MKRVYLDYAATTPTHPGVIAAMLHSFQDVWGNPSSVHACGQEARTAVEEAREKLAHLVGAQPDEIYFTSGGTEADNWALKGAVAARHEPGSHIITTPIEHHAVLETCEFLKEQGCSITFVPVDRYGMVDPDDVRKAITPKTVIISIMHANNEVGTIQPIAEIGKIARTAGVYFHTDAVQTVGHIPVDVNQMNLDILSISAHKLYGPKGIGALYIRRGTKIPPFVHGGGQERHSRAGTENVPGIVGLGKAAELAQEEMDGEARRLTMLRDRLIKSILDKIEHTCLNGHPTRRLPNNVNVSFRYVEGEAICLNLDLAGVCVATGSACSSTSMEASHVLTAMGLPPELARASLRFSFGKWSTEDDVDFVLQSLPKAVSRLRAISPLVKK